MSSVDQNLDRQLEAVGDVDRVFQEKVSGGSRAERVALLDCIRDVREGDVVKVASMDRLARSLGDLRETVDEITVKDASVVCVKEQQACSRDTGDANGRLMLNLLGAFAEFERTLIRERQREGTRLAQAAGKYKGRAQKLTAEQLVDARRLIESGAKGEGGPGSGSRPDDSLPGPGSRSCSRSGGGVRRPRRSRAWGASFPGT